MEDRHALDVHEEERVCQRFDAGVVGRFWGVAREGGSVGNLVEAASLFKWQKSVVVILRVEDECQTKLLLIVDAGAFLGLFLGIGQDRQQQRRENRDDGNYYQKLNQRKTLRSRPMNGHEP